MYQVLHDMGEVIDHDLQPGEKAHLTEQLNEVIQAAPGTNLSLLAHALNQFLAQESLHMTEHLPAWQQRWVSTRMAVRERIQRSQSSHSRFRMALALLLLFSGGIIVARVALQLGGLAYQTSLINWLLQEIIAGQITNAGQLRWVVIRLVLEGGFGLLMAVSGLLLMAARERLSTRLASLSLVMMLTTVNLLVFYFDQFAAAATALAQYALLALVMVYRRWFVDENRS
jgi:hypothetical protein